MFKEYTNKFYRNLRMKTTEGQRTLLFGRRRALLEVTVGRRSIE